jgi:hypothetical protein
MLLNIRKNFSLNMFKHDTILKRVTTTFYSQGRSHCLNQNFKQNVYNSNTSKYSKMC